MSLTKRGDESTSYLEPVRERHATLVDLLDRVLDKGVVLHADIIVSVAGIPLIGVTLRAALAGMETMLKYGMMEAWDESIRSWETNYRKLKQRDFLKNDQVILDTLGAHFYKKGIYAAWRYGHFYLTDNTLFLYHETYDEVLLKIDLAQIRGMVVRSEKSFTNRTCEVLYVIVDNEKVHRLRSRDVHTLKNTIATFVADNGTYTGADLVIPEYEDSIATILADGEEVTHRGRLWHLYEENAAGSIANTTWRPGKLYLTNRRLCWWYQTESKFLLDIPIESICGCYEDEKSWSLFKQDTPVLDLVYEQDSVKRVASFSGQGVEDWREAIQSAINQNGTQPVRAKESCPKCNQLSDIEHLLNKGCSHCGWMSARMQRKALGAPV
ncbi:gas vesicle protein [Acidobacteria bacterium AH-259-G07]|nr:gas vesicle protein [Acidobacteria bacterium AH-259-G07]